MEDGTPPTKRPYSEEPRLITGYRQPLGFTQQKEHVNFLWNKAQALLTQILAGTGVSTSQISELAAEIDVHATAPPDPNESRYLVTPTAKDDLLVEVYNRMQSLLNDQAEQVAQKISVLEDSPETPDTSILQFYSTEYGKYAKAARNCAILYRHLNENWVPAKRRELIAKKRESISLPLKLFDMAMIIWRKIVFSKVAIKVKTCLLSEIDKDRRGEPARTETFRDAVGSLVDLGVDLPAYEEADSGGFHHPLLPPEDLAALQAERKAAALKRVLFLYTGLFEVQFLKGVASYYGQEAERLQTELENKVVNNMELLQKVDQHFEREKGRSEKFLHPVTVTKVYAILQKQLICNNMDTIMACCDRIVEDQKPEEIQMYQRVLSRVGGAYLDTFTACLRNHFESKGRAILDKHADKADDVFMDELCSLYTKQETTVNSVLKGDKRYVEAFHQAFKAVLRDNELARKAPVRQALVIGRSMNRLLEKSNKKHDMNDKMNRLSVLIKILNCLDNKDVYYRIHYEFLSNRLLFDTSSDEQLEDRIASLHDDLLKKYKHMRKDMILTEDLNRKFREVMGRPAYPLKVNVVTATFWPVAGSIVSWIIPEVIQSETRRFQEYYGLHVGHGKRLTWLWGKSRAEINFYPPGTKKRVAKRLQVRMEQAIVLLQFKDVDSMTFSELSAYTNLNKQELSEVLRILMKAKLLEWKGEEGEAFEVVRFLNKWPTNSERITLWMMNGKDRNKLDPKMEEDVQVSRNSTVRSSIIRNMKAKKGLSENELIGKILDENRDEFVPDVTFIQTALNSLVEQDYLTVAEVEEGGTKVRKYAYVA